MRSRTLTEWIGDLGPEATARDVLNLAYVGVSSLGHQAYYDHDDVQAEVADVPSLVMVGTEPGVGDWAEYLDGSRLYFSELGAGRWRSWVDHPSRFVPAPEFELRSLESVASAVEIMGERSQEAVESGSVPDAVVSDQDFRLRQLARDASAVSIALTVVDDERDISTRFDGGVDVHLPDGSRLSIWDPHGGTFSPVWEVRHDHPNYFVVAPTYELTSVQRVAAAITDAEAQAQQRIADAGVPVWVVTPFEFECRQLGESSPAMLVGRTAARTLASPESGLGVRSAAMAGQDRAVVEVVDAREAVQVRMLISSPQATVHGGWQLDVVDSRTGERRSDAGIESVGELGMRIAAVWREVAGDEVVDGRASVVGMGESFSQAMAEMQRACVAGNFGEPEELHDAAPQSSEGSLDSGAAL